MATTAKKSSKKKAAKKTAPKKSTVKKAAVKKQTVKKKAVKKKTASKKVAKKTAKSTNSNNKKIKVTHEQRHKMICEAAYYISLNKTHETVNPTADWLEAETFIDQICTVGNN